jgi:hypothetical protein
LPVDALDDASHFDSRVGAELAGDVAHVRLDGSRAEEQQLGDLAVGPAVDDEASSTSVRRAS